MPITERTFWATKPVQARYETLTFEHTELSQPFRIVRNEFAAVTLGGDSYTPVAAEIRPPGPSDPKLVVSFARQQVGRAFKNELRTIRAAGSREPISVTYAVWLGDTDAPKRTFTLYADELGGINFDGQTVQVSAVLDRLRRVSRAPRYLPEVFTGLELL